MKRIDGEFWVDIQTRRERERENFEHGVYIDCHQDGDFDVVIRSSRPERGSRITFMALRRVTIT